METPAAVATEVMTLIRISVLNFSDYDEKGNYKIYRADHRVDCIGDTDGPWGYVVYESLDLSTTLEMTKRRERHPIGVPLLFL